MSPLNNGVIKDPPDNKVKVQEVLPKIAQLTPPNISQEAELKNRASHSLNQAGTALKALFTDFNWSRMVLNTIYIVSIVLAFTSLGNSNIPAMLEMAVFPFFLLPALQLTKDRFNMMKSSYKISKPAQTAFWAGRAIGIFESALDNFKVLLLGGALIFGATQITVLSGSIFPPLLLAMCTMGVLAESQEIIKTFKAQKELKLLKEESDKASDRYTQFQKESDKSLKKHNQLKKEAEEAYNKHLRLEELSRQSFEKMRLALQDREDQKALNAKINDILNERHQLKEKSAEALAEHNQLQEEAAKALEKYNELKASKDSSLEEMASTLQPILGSKSIEQTSEIVKEANRSLIEYLASNPAISESDKDMLRRLSELSLELLDPEKGSELKLIDKSLDLIQELKAVYKEQPQIEMLNEKQEALIRLKIEEYTFQNRNFSSNEGRVSLQGRVSHLLQSDALKKTASKVNTVFDALKQDDDLPSLDSLTEKPLKVTKLMSQVQSFSTAGLSDFEIIDRVLPLYNQLEALSNELKDESVKKWLDTSIEEVRRHRQELEDLKGSLLEEGAELLETAQAEIKRVILCHVVFLLLGALSIAAKVLITFHIPNPEVVLALYLALSAIDFVYIISELSISREKFLDMVRSRKKPSVTDVNEVDPFLRRSHAVRRGQENLA
ncbi:MAG: hypothetical protein WAM28_04480 [Chlamydiales bacterium]